jgi:ABC-2 type transport system ATP-binding protein
MSVGWTCRVPAPAVRLRGLSKRYGAVTVIDGVDLDLAAGRYCGLLGPTGAGKSTVLAMASGQLRPDAGRVEISGSDMWAHRAATEPLVGVLRSEGRPADELTGSQLLAATGRLRELPDTEVARRLGTLLPALHLHGAMGQPVGEYSAGMRSRLGLARALLHEPRVLFLDEPFARVDGGSALMMRRVLDHYVGRGGTVVLASADPDLVERLCATVTVLAGGRLLAHGPLDRIRGDRPLNEAYAGLLAAERGMRAAAGVMLPTQGGEARLLAFPSASRR